MSSEEILDPAHEEEGAVVAPPVDDTPAAGEKVSEDGNVLERGGRKYVPHEALKEARAQAKQYKETLARLEAIAPEIQETLNRKAQGKADKVKESIGDDYSVDELEEVARLHGFVDEWDRPNLEKAKKQLDIQARISNRVAQKTSAPLQQLLAQQIAQQRRSEAVSRKYTDGDAVASEKYIDAAYNALPAELLQDPNVAQLALVVAAGLESLDDRKNGRGRKQPRDPMFLEGGNGRFGSTEGQLSAFDRAAARARGKTDAEWAALMGKKAPSASVDPDILDEV